MRYTKDTLLHEKLCAEMVGHDDGKLSITLPTEHTVEWDYSVATQPGTTAHIIIARCYCPLLSRTRSWLCVYRMHTVRVDGEVRGRYYGYFNHARTMEEARTMAEQLIDAAQRERDHNTQQLALSL